MRNKFQGPAGVVTQQIVPKVPERPAWEATLRMYFAHLPGQSTMWNKYQLAVIHLRDIPGAKPPIKDSPDVDYELMICALDPYRNPTCDDFRSQLPLLPINLALQFAGTDDQLAIRICDAAAEALAAGRLLAEPQFSSGPGSAHYEEWQRFVEHVKQRG